MLVPPSIVADPPDGNFVVKKGKHIELRCKAAGNPPPDVHWTKEVISFNHHSIEDRLMIQILIIGRRLAIKWKNCGAQLQLGANLSIKTR